MLLNIPRIRILVRITIWHREFLIIMSVCVPGAITDKSVDTLTHKLPFDCDRAVFHRLGQKSDQINSDC